jgi:predicted dienelactone hydrolase
MTIRLDFEKDWRAYRAATSYDVPKPLADILVSRGFAVVTPPPPQPKAKKATRKRKKPNATNKNA